MSGPTAIIAEDEPVLRAEIRETLSSLWPDLVICAECSNGVEAANALERFAPQILFLDLQMPGMTGLDVARQAGGRAHVVFVTAFDQHAIAAFEQGALDYVVKPVSAARLAITVERLKARLRSAPADLRGIEDLLKRVAVDDKRYLKWLTVPHGGELQLVTTEEICYLRADNKYTSVVTADAEFLLTSPLKDLKDKLDPEHFWQVHRGVIVNVNAIRTIHRTFRGGLELRLKERNEVLPVSSAHAHLFKTV